jgi:hypothetical protein
MTQITISFIHRDNGQIAVVKLDNSATIQEAIDKLIENDFIISTLPDYTHYTLATKDFEYLVQRYQTLDDAKIKDGDILFVIPPAASGGVFVRSFREIQIVEAILDRNKSDYVNKQVLFAIFLYTDDDTHLSSYIRNNVRELHFMAGCQCLFFVIESPTSEWSADVRRELGELAKEHFGVLWERLDAKKFRPFDKTQAYNIGRRFGVTPKQFPCIVFFSELNTKNISIIEINEFIDYKEPNLDTEYTKFFRILFSVAAETTLYKPQKDWLSELSRLVSKEWQRTTKKNIALIESKELTITMIEVIGTIVKSFFTKNV